MGNGLANYEGSPLRLFLGIAASLADPVGALLGPAENAILDRHKRIRAERLEELVKHLELDAVTLQTAIDSDEGIHAIVVVIEAAQRTRSRKKQRAFAKLLSQYLRSGELSRNVRKFEDFFCILEELTETEFKILLILNGFDLGREEGRAKVWAEAKARIEEEMKASSSEVDARLSRLTRTGLCTEEKVWGRPMFSISPLYGQFVQYLELGNYRSL